MGKAPLSKLTCAALVLLCMALVLWVRLVPLSLPVTEDWAERIARRQLQSQPGAAADARVDQWIDQHKSEFAAMTTAIARRLKSALSYTADDGGEYAYLGDYDSYLWLRHARNYLRTGTPCDTVVDGVCRDTYTNAPVGARTSYARSLHVAVIAGLHRVVSLFRPRFPLPRSSFLVPVIVGVLGVAPAFFIARSLAGTIAGPFAVVLTALHPIVLARTIGSDNDIWNVVLPLYMMWAVLGGLAAPDVRRRSLYAALAGVCAGLQAWAWRGWLFSYAVVIVGLLGTGLLLSARHAIRQRTFRVWRAPEVRHAALLIVVFYAVAGLATRVAGSEEAYLTIPARAVMAVMRPAAAEHPGHGGVETFWPNALTRVAEIQPLRFWTIASDAGGASLFLGGLVGLLLLLLPRRQWRWWDRAVLLGGAALYAFGLVGIEPGRLTTMAVLIATLGAALLAQWYADEATTVAERGMAFLLVVWLLAALYTAYDGIRFLLLLAPPLGIAGAVAIARLCTSITRLIQDNPRWYRIMAYALLGGVLTLALLHPLRWGYAAARLYTPSMHDAWWDSLTHIRDTAKPDAIVHTWWDYGHWVTYVAERRVSNDGSSLLTHIPHWLGKSLVASSEAESVGVLRMLSCGSDATPSPEGREGAYGKLRSMGRDPVTTYDTLLRLVNVDKNGGEALLAGGGFTASERVSILRSTHCDPPEAYLILSSKLVHKRRSWMAFGQWDARRLDGPLQRPPASRTDAVAERGHDGSESESDGLTVDIGGTRHTRETRLDRFNDLPAVPLLPRWLPCRSGRDAGMMCDVQSRVVPTGPVLNAFIYHAGAPQNARLQSGQRDGGTAIEGVPGVVLLAGARLMQEVAFAAPTYPDLGVLIDVPHDRILVGAPALLRSTFVHLMYLDGRYATHYKKFDDRTDLGERVVTWKIDWQAK